jgi:hypothetical protein
LNNIYCKETLLYMLKSRAYVNLRIAWRSVE